MERARGGLELIAAKLLQQAEADQRPALAWPVVAGAAVAERTRVLGLSDGIYKVAVPDKGWCKQLEGFGYQYRAALNRLLGSAEQREPVQRIDFVTDTAAIGGKL